MKLVLVAACALIDADGRVLIAQRPAGKPMAGLWEFPGGKRQPGEDAAAALVREIREELGALLTVGEVIDTVDWQYPEKSVRLVFFRGTIAGEPRPLEGQEMAWVVPADLSHYEFPPADASLLERLTAGRRGGP